MRRTRVKDFNKIEQAKDLESLVKDKRVTKRATMKNAIRRNRRYKNNLLSHLIKGINDEF
ncbi:MAG: hypothetical protein VXZ50_03175 [Bacteroidota bacterium]|nr:hypothetical protein [Bacteroidota bacterium]